MLIKLLCLFLSMLLFTSCTQFEFSPKNLMRPPKLTQEQLEIFTALENAVGDKTIKYKYPKNGDYRSSFVFYDLDEDGEAEALAFYQAESKGSSTRVNILDHSDAGWVSVYDIPSPSNETNIDFISFEPLLHSNRENIVIGWVNEYLNEKNVVVYSFDGQRMREEYREYYDELAFLDINSDSSLDLLLVTNNSYSDTSTVSMVTRVTNSIGKTVLEEVSSLNLSHACGEILQLTQGKVGASTNALFIDSNINVHRSPKTLITQAVTAYRNELINLLDTENVRLSDDTIRPTSTLCQDIDRDGIIEIPTVSPLPGYSVGEDEEVIYRTTFNKLGSGNAWEPVRNCVINESHRYMITLPESWNRHVTIVNQPETGEWTFLRYSDKKSEPGTALLRLKVYSVKDYHDKFENDFFFLLGKQGLFEYYAYIPENSDPLHITPQELAQMFSFVQ